MAAKPSFEFMHLSVVGVVCLVLVAELTASYSVVEPTVALEGRSLVVSVSGLSAGAVVQLWKGGANCSDTDSAQVFASQQASSSSVNVSVCTGCSSAGVLNVCMLSPDSGTSNNDAYSLLGIVEFLQVRFAPSTVNLELSNLSTSDDNYTFPLTALFYVGVLNSATGDFLPELCMSAADCDGDLNPAESNSEKVNITEVLDELSSSYLVVTDEGEKCPSLSVLQSTEPGTSLSAWSPITVTSVSSTSNRWMATANNFSVGSSLSGTRGTNWLAGDYYVYVIPGENQGSSKQSGASITSVCPTGRGVDTCSAVGVVYLNRTNGFNPNSQEMVFPSGSTAVLNFSGYPNTTFRFSNSTETVPSQAILKERWSLEERASGPLQLATSEAVGSVKQLVCSDQPNGLPTFTTNSSGLAEVDISASTSSGPEPLSAGMYLVCRKETHQTNASASGSSLWIPVTTLKVFLPIYYSIVTGTSLVVSVPTPVLLGENLTTNDLLKGVYESPTCSGSPLSSSEGVWSAAGPTEISIDVIVNRSAPVYLCASIPANESSLALPATGLSVLSPSPVQFPETFEACSPFNVSLSGGADPAAEVAVSIGPCCPTAPGSTPIPAVKNVAAILQPTAPGVRTLSISGEVVDESIQTAENFYMCFSDSQNSCLTVGTIKASSTSSCTGAALPNGSGNGNDKWHALLIAVIVIGVLLVCALGVIFFTCWRLRKLRSDKNRKTREENLVVKVVDGAHEATRQDVTGASDRGASGNLDGAPEFSNFRDASEGVKSGNVISLNKEGAAQEIEPLPDSLGLDASVNHGSEGTNTLKDDRSAFHATISTSENVIQKVHNYQKTKKTLIPRQRKGQREQAELQRRSSTPSKLVSETNTKGVGSSIEEKKKQGAFPLSEARDAALSESDVDISVSTNSSDTGPPSFTAHSRQKAEQEAPLEENVHRTEWSDASEKQDEAGRNSGNSFSGVPTEMPTKNLRPLPQAILTATPNILGKNEDETASGKPKQIAAFAAEVPKWIQAEQDARCLLYKEEDEALQNHIETAHAQWKKSINSEGQRLCDVLQRTALQAGQSTALVGANERVFEQVVEGVGQSSVAAAPKEEQSFSTKGSQRWDDVALLEQRQEMHFIATTGEEYGLHDENDYSHKGNEKALPPSALPFSSAAEPPSRIGQYEDGESEEDLEEGKSCPDLASSTPTTPHSSAGKAAAVVYSDPTNAMYGETDQGTPAIQLGERKNSDSTSAHHLPPPSLDSDDE